LSQRAIAGIDIGGTKTHVRVARGGETIDSVRLEFGDGPISLPPGAVREIGPLKAGWKSYFRVQVDGPPATKASVRLVQSARVPREYVVPLEITQ